MKFSRVNLLVMLIIVGSGSVYVATNPPVPESHIRHGLKVFIDPNTGTFAKPEPGSVNLLTKVRGLLSPSSHKETPSFRKNGGYTVNLEHHYRPSGLQNNQRPGS